MFFEKLPFCLEIAVPVWAGINDGQTMDKRWTTHG